MEVNDVLIDKLANLARLTFNDTEKAEIRSDLQQMISFIEKLQEVNTDGVEPLFHMSSHSNVLRDDAVRGSITREDALKNAPDSDGTFFRVPKVIKK
ncbi:MAG: Asp-tRNA(Asn)/Glu-tRNA(Gln) amidotransferase subunit GatC [Flavitalea sp.]